MRFPTVTLADWRAQVEKELAGKPFDKVLAQEVLAGLKVDPLYIEAPPQDVPWRAPHREPFRICVRVPAGATADACATELAEGADALWMNASQIPIGNTAGTGGIATRDAATRVPFFLIEKGEADTTALASLALSKVPRAAEGFFALGIDIAAARASGASSAAPDRRAAELGEAARLLEERAPRAIACTVSTLTYHDAGADAAYEIALALSSGVLHLEALLAAGLSPERAASKIALQVGVASDTFLEMCKLRALRTCWHKVLVASGVAKPARTMVHAVASMRTMAARDPWVNMLRVTTQVFAAVLGGADLVTPRPFDDALTAPSVLGRRVARNTGLVLREESYLGQVTDAAGGSYYFETLTDALARKAWGHFQAIEKQGGIASALATGQVAAAIDTTWKARLEALSRRKAPLLGVSEFANLDEELPAPPPRIAPPIPPKGAIEARRDSSAFEHLRNRADAKKTPPQVILVTLGAFAESRGRVGFASNFFAAGGFRTRESATDEPCEIACICGTDERYATEAVDRVRALKAAGCKRVLLAGRPGALEDPLRQAGIDGFIFVGCDVVTTLSDLLDTPS